MAQATFTINIPTTSYNTSVVELGPNWFRFNFYWYGQPNGSTSVEISNCFNWTVGPSVPNGQGGCSVTITYDNGQGMRIEPSENGAEKRPRKLVRT